jgi:hypothetical protein
VPFMDLLMRDPSLASKLANPRVQKALEEISKSPWKTIKYVLDKEVMEVFTVSGWVMDGWMETGRGCRRGRGRS